MTSDTQQYFAANPDSQSNAKPFELIWQGKKFVFYTDRGVFSKGELDRGTKVLISALPENITGRLLDLGCGWGAAGLLVKAFHPSVDVTMCDINERAVSLARRNIKENRLQAEAILSDGLANVQGKFDLIIFNPPIRAGKTTVYRLFDEAADRLLKNGALYVVIRKQQGAASAYKYLTSRFNSVQTVSKEAGYHVFQCKECLDDAI